MSVLPNPSKHRITFLDEDKGKREIIVKNFEWDGWTEIYTATIDLKAFIKGFANHLANNKDLPFTDVLGDPKTGKFMEEYGAKSNFAKPSAHLTRNRTYFEKAFTWAKYPGFNEIELVWQAKAKSKFSDFGWIVFKMDLVARVIKDVEVVENGEKKIMQKASWEFRNTLTYYNSYVRDALWKIPVVKNSAEIQRLMIDHVYFPNLERDFEFVNNKVKPLLYDYIFKTFRE